MWEVYVRIIGVEMKSFDTNRTDNGEGKPLCIHTLIRYAFKVLTDVEGRRLREWRGLDTPVAWADNDECHRLAFGWTINESGSTPPQE